MSYIWLYYCFVSLCLVISPSLPFLMLLSEQGVGRYKEGCNVDRTMRVFPLGVSSEMLVRRGCRRLFLFACCSLVLVRGPVAGCVALKKVDGSVASTVAVSGGFMVWGGWFDSAPDACDSPLSDGRVGMQGYPAFFVGLGCLAFPSHVLFDLLTFGVPCCKASYTWSGVVLRHCFIRPRLDPLPPMYPGKKPIRENEL